MFNHQILVNGAPFFITQNLYGALKQFQSGIALHETKFPLKLLFWIDAICINQTENAEAMQERSEQVKNMTNIYKNAETIYVWLGVSSDSRQNRAAAVRMRSFRQRLLANQAKALGGYQPW